MLQCIFQLKKYDKVRFYSKKKKKVMTSKMTQNIIETNNLIKEKMKILFMTFI